MDPSETDRLDRLEQRVNSLEATVRALAPSSAAPALSAAATPPVTSAAVAASTPSAATVAASKAASKSASSPMWTAATEPTASPTTATNPPRTFRDLEEQFSGRLLAWLGGTALVIGGAFFLSLAFSRGWIGPEARVVIGLVASGAALAAGSWLFERGQGIPALVLAAVGVAVGMLALFAATRLYGFIPPELALLGSLLLAAAAAAISIQANSASVAVLGLLEATLAPVVMGGPITPMTMILLGSALLGTTVIATYRSWAWLPLVAYLTTAPQLAMWLWDDPGSVPALAMVAGYWAVSAAGAVGNGLRRPSMRVHLASATLLVLVGLFTIGAIRVVLTDAEPWLRLVADGVLAAAFGAIGLPFLVRSRGREPMGVLAVAVAVGVAVIGIALELDAVARPVAWSSIALVIAWVAVRFDRRDAAAGAAVIASLVIGYIAAVVYPISDFGDLPAINPAVPFTSPEAVAVLVIAGAAAGFAAWAAWFGRPDAEQFSRKAGDLRELYAVGSGIGAIALVAYASFFELRGVGVVLAWSAAAAAAFAFARFAPRSVSGFVVGYTAGATLVGLALIEALATVAPRTRLTVDPTQATTIVPVVNEATLALTAVLATVVLGAALIPPGLLQVRTGLGRPTTWVTLGAYTAAIIGTYLGSIAVVDVFAIRVDPAVPDAADEIATQAQVALTIAWVIAGAAAFAIGIVRDVTVARVYGLALLALATAKLFLVDLASVEVAYRVLSFIGVGLVLLGSSFLATRRRARRRASPSIGESPTPG